MSEPNLTEPDPELDLGLDLDLDRVERPAMGGQPSGRGSAERTRAAMLERLAIPDAVLSRTDLATLGWQRRAVDAIFRQAAREHGLVILPGYSRPLITVAAYRAVLEAATSRDGERVWP